MSTKGIFLKALGTDQGTGAGFLQDMRQQSRCGMRCHSDRVDTRANRFGKIRRGT